MISERVIDRCKALGIKGPAAFGRRYGRRLADLSEEKALAYLDGTNPIGERWQGLGDFVPMTGAEETAWKTWWRERAAGKEEPRGNDPGGTDNAPAAHDDADHRGRPGGPRAPRFGEPYGG